MSEPIPGNELLLRLRTLNEAISRVIAEHNTMDDPKIKGVDIEYHLTEAGMHFSYDIAPAQSTINDQVQDSLDRSAISDAVQALADAMRPDEMYDPADDPRPAAAVMRLADLLSNIRPRVAAEGVQMALDSMIGRKS
jgi:hypothetical protein